MASHNALKYSGQEIKIGHCPVIFQVILVEGGGGFFNRGKMRAKLKCEGKEPPSE